MRRRKNISYGKSKRLFRQTAGVNGMHPRNQWNTYNMRGGIRL